MINYKFIDKSVWLDKEKILVIADLHLGYEDALKEQGVFIPKFQYKKIIEDLEKIFEEIDKLDNKNKLVNKKTINNIKSKVISECSINNKKEKRINEIIILGDLKHEFGGNLNQEWKETLDLIGFLKKKTKKIILIRGNHDNYLINIVKRQGIKLVDFYIKKIKNKKICFMHGHKLFNECLDRNIKLILLGHMHPAISIAKNVKKETYKCFLVGRWKNKGIIILPSFFPLVEGVEVSIEDTNLAFKLDLRKFEVYVVGDKVYDFGKVKDVGRLIN